ncbi:MAG: hypothetical protein ACI8W7_002165, partial [Gammaproteobacteria bacterium]
MADEENNEQPADRPATTRKKTAKKAAVRKKRAVRADIAELADGEEASAAVVNEASVQATPAAPAAIPAAAPQPAAAVIAPAMQHDHEVLDQGISGWLVMWGPLIIFLFLILVYMGKDERVVKPVAAAPAAAPAAQARQIPVLMPEQPELSISPERAAEDLAAAFKAAGIPLPEPREVPVAAEPADVAVPPALQGNPWAPGAPPPPTQGDVPAPSPTYGSQPPHWGPPQGFPPRGYGYA